MNPTPVYYGPIGSSGAKSSSSGKLDKGVWRIPGRTRPHELKLDSGEYGSGPIHVRVDGKLVQTFDAPTPKTAVTTPPMDVDGNQVAVRIARPMGLDYDVDVYVNGISFFTGQSPAVVEQRAAVEVAIRRETTRVKSLASAEGSIWIAIIVATFPSLRSIVGEPHAAVGLLGLAAVDLAVLIILELAVQQAKAGKLAYRNATGFGCLVPLLALLGALLAGVVGLLLAR